MLMKTLNFKKILSFIGAFVLVYMLITPLECYANSKAALNIGDSITDNSLSNEYRQYTFTIKEKMEIKISVSVDKLLNSSGNNSISLELTDEEGYSYIDFWEVYEGNLQAETFELDKGKYTISVLGYTGDLEQLHYSLSTENVSIYADNISIPEKATIFVNDSKKLKTALLPSGTYIPGITWSSSNENIAVVSNYGTVKGISAGECIIKARLDGGNVAKCKVTVVSLYATKISTSEKISLLAGSSKALPLKILEGGKKINAITWTSSNKKIAKVNAKGKITGIKAGTCTISGKMKNGNLVKCLVTVKARPQLFITEASFEINFIGGVEPYITFQNNFGKTIKYVYFSTYYYNTVDDPAYCSIQNTNYCRLKITGPISNKTTDTYYWDAVIYNNSTGKMYIKSADVVFMDGTKKTVSIKKSYR